MSGAPEAIPDWRIVERGADIDEVARLLRENNAVCIHGMSGSGKTTLARQVERRLAAKGQKVAFIDARESSLKTGVVGGIQSEDG